MPDPTLAAQAGMAVDAALTDRIRAALLRVARAVIAEIEQPRGDPGSVEEKAWQRWNKRRAYAYTLIKDSAAHIEAARWLLSADTELLIEYLADPAVPVTDTAVLAAVDAAWTALSGA